MSRLAATGTILCAFLAAILGARAQAQSAPQPTKAPPLTNASPLWDGLYIGGHAGFAWGHNSTVGVNLLGPSSPAAGQVARGAFAGLHAGFDYMLAPHWLVGVKIDVSGTGIRSHSFADAPARDIQSHVVLFETARARVGHAFDRMLLYGSAGIAAGTVEVRRLQVSGTANFATPGTVENNSYTSIGYAGGVGLDYALSRHWVANAEFLYVDIGKGTYLQPLSVIRTTRHIHFNTSQLGVSYRF